MNRQELKFDAKNKMREAAVNPYVVTLIMGVILMVLSGVQFILDFWGNIIGTGSSVNTGEASTYIVSSLVFFVIYLVISTILQLGWVHVLWRFVFIGSLSAESRRADAYDIGFCPALVYTACNTGYHCSVPLFPGHLHHG